MARRYRAKRKRVVRRRGRKRGGVIARMQRQIRLMAPEVKFDYPSLSNVGFNWSGVAYDMTALIANGTDVNERIGAKLMLKNITGRLNIQTLNNNNVTNYRIVWVCVRNNPNYEIDGTTFWSYFIPAANLATELAPLSPVNLLNKSLYKIMYDRTFTARSNGLYWNSQSNNQVAVANQRVHRFNFPLNKIVRFSDSGSTQSIKNTVIMAIIGSESSTSDFQADGSFAVRYTDC